MERCRQVRREASDEGNACLSLHPGSQRDGESEAIVRRVLDMRRFTREEHEHGDTAGWRYEVGWFVRMSGLTWAWFSRDSEEEDRNGND